MRRFAGAARAAATAAVLMASAAFGASEPRAGENAAAEELGWRMAVQAWSFNRFTFFESVDKAASIGVKYIEAFPGQRVGGDVGNAGMGPGLNPEQRRAVKKKLDDAGVKLVCFGVTGAGGEGGWRSLLKFAKEMGIESITTEAGEGEMETIDRLLREYDMRIAIHNHPKPSHYWSPETVLGAAKGRSERIGACADTGHWNRSGLVPIECLRKLEGRITSLHFKDLNQKGGGHDVPWGTGACEARKMLFELARQGFKGVFSAEYEHNWDRSLPEIRQCAEFLYKTAEEVLEAKKDRTPPSAPTRLSAKAAGISEVRLSWGASRDAESGVACYRVLRDGQKVAEIDATEYVDTALSESTTYRYEVIAANLGGKESSAAKTTATTPRDTEPPEVVSVSAAGTRTRVTIAFSEPVDPKDAASASNYSILGGVRVRSAEPSADGKSVVLTTSELDEGKRYELSVRNVKDTAKKPNAIARGAPVDFKYAATGTGLLGSYFKGMALEGPATERLDARVDFNWGGPPMDGFPSDSFSVRWAGSLRADRPGEHEITVTTDDGVRAWLDGKQIIDDWVNRGPTPSRAKVSLTALHEIRIEFFENSGGAVAKLEWSGPSTGGEQKVVPPENLYPAAGASR